jgi:MFS family permease
VIQNDQDLTVEQPEFSFAFNLGCDFNKYGDPVTANTDSVSSDAATIVTDIPARLDRLPWGRFHSLVVLALGITWILDGLEVTLAGSLGDAIRRSLHLTSTDIGVVGSAYVLGAVSGALFFGWLTDRLGRRKLFFITLTVYLIFAAATALSWSLASLAVFRFLTGAGIGGEYAAINSTIQELIPARYRGWTDLAINGSFWVGAAIASLSSLVVLDEALFAAGHGWRVAFLVGAMLAMVIYVMRLWIPESPRWLMTHGRADEGAAIVAHIEAGFRRNGATLSPVTAPPLRLRVRSHTPVREVVTALVDHYPRRALVGLALMTAQAFFYNAIFFTYALVLTDFYSVRSDQVGWYLLPFAAGNFCGPLILGRAFDTIGRRPMIASTYVASGLLLATSGVLFLRGAITAEEQTAAWMIIFFVASAAASSAYLTVSETFPLEIRALAIAIFFAIGTGIGGVVGPSLFGALIDTGSRLSVFIGYLIGAALMVGAGIIQWRFGVAAERRSLEEVAPPLTRR